MPITDPLDLTGCVLWLDGSQETFSNGDPVPTWTDRSGNGNHATQATAGNRPTYDAATLGINFDGVNDYLVLPGGLFDIGAGSTYIAGFYAEDNTVRYMLAATDFTVGQGNSRRWYFVAIDATQMSYYIGGETPQQNAPWQMTYPNDDPRRRVWGLRSDGNIGYGSMSCHDDQSQAFPAGTLPWTGAATLSVLLGAALSGGGGTQQHLSGQEFEVVHYDRKLTDAENNDVMEYLKVKWRVACGGEWVIGMAPMSTPTDSGWQ